MTTTFSFQPDGYNYHLGRNYFGRLARPGEPYAIDNGIAGEDLNPGDAVYFDDTAAELDFKKPATAANLLLVTGIVLYDEGYIPDASGNVVISSGSTVKVGVMGSFYAQAGSDLTYGQQLIWDNATAEQNWSVLTRPTTYAAAHLNPAFFVERSAEDGDLIIIRFHGPIR